MTPAIVFFDLETGGTEAARPDIQLAAIAVELPSWRELESFEIKIQFNEKDAHPDALRMNHYSAEAWAAAVPESEAVRLFQEFLKPYCCVKMTSKGGKPYSVAQLAGHHAVEFDGPRLRRMFSRHDRFFSADPRILDTMQLAMWHFAFRGPTPLNYKLSTLAERLKISFDHAHEALTDVRLCAEVAHRILGGR